MEMSSAACVAEFGEVDVDWASLVFCFKIMEDSAQATDQSNSCMFCHRLGGSAKHRKMADFDPSGSQNP